MPPHRTHFDVEREMQRHGDALRALAGVLVRDPNVADDAVQDVWLAALQRPPRDARAIGGWLVTALHNVVRMWRRGEQRREQRDEHVGAEHAQRIDDAGEAAAREDQARRLLDALATLEPPFRDTIWNRFFAGMAPREIAAAHAVPVATVKSRLQRGLGMLRARLGEREGGGWRAGFAAAFGLRESGAAVPLLGAAATGGVLMATWTKVAGAIAAVAVAAFVCWPVSERATTVAGAPGATTPALQVAAELDARAEQPPAAAAPADAPRTAAAQAPAAHDPRFAIVRGRCVDERGAPLANCRVELHGWEGNRDRTAAWLAEHMKIDWSNPQVQTTGADGVFEFAFLPLPPLQFALWITRTGAVRMDGRWPSLDERQVVDVGDVAMQPGIALRGRVVDTNGAPCEGVALDFQQVKTARPTGAERRTVVARTSDSAHSDASGRFAGRSVVPPGTYRLHASSDRGWQLQGPTSIELAAGHSAPFEIVVAMAKTTIHGKVVDAHDAPVAAACIEAMVAGVDRSLTTRSQTDGSFVLACPKDDAPPTHLVATAKGREAASSERAIAWGSRDVVLRFTQATTPFIVHVSDEHGAAIEEFSVHATTSEDIGNRTQPLRASGPHANGTATLPEVGVGAHIVFVEFPAASGRTPLLRCIEISAAQRRLDLRSSRGARVVRVVREDGSPVAGTRVQCCLLPGSALEVDTTLVPRDRWHTSYRGALVLNEASTDAEGRCTIAGSGEQLLGLRVLGPGHVPLLVPTMTVDVAEELVVTVARGGSLRGRIVPEMAVAELARLAAAARNSGYGHHVHVMLKQGTRSFPVGRAMLALPDEPAAQDARIGADGSFALTHVPSGEWDLEVHFLRANETIRSIATDRAAGPRVQITDGRVTTVEVDLGAIVPGRLVGTVLCNGEPLANALVYLEGVGQSAFTFPRTDAQGRFEYSGPARTLGLRVTDQHDKPLPVPLHASNTVTMLRQTTVEHTFVIATGALDLLVLDATGKPAPRAKLWIADPDAQLPAANAEGRVRCELAAGSFALRTLPKSLQPDDAQHRERLAATRDKRPGDWRAPHWLDVGAATVLAGQTSRLEVRLPPTW